MAPYHREREMRVKLKPVYFIKWKDFGGLLMKFIYLYYSLGIHVIIVLVSLAKDQVHTDLDREMLLSLREKEWKLKQSRTDSATPRNFFCSPDEFFFPRVTGKATKPTSQVSEWKYPGEGRMRGSWFWRIQPLYLTLQTEAHILMSPPSQVSQWSHHKLN